MSAFDKLNEKQQKFVLGIAAGKSKTQAYIAAGYSAPTATHNQWRLMGNETIRTAIDAIVAERVRKFDISLESLSQELASVAFADMKEFAEWGQKETTAKGKDKKTNRRVESFVDLKDSVAIDGRAVCEVSKTIGKQGVTTKLKLHDKVKALEILTRMAMIVEEKKTREAERDNPSSGAVWMVRKTDAWDSTKDDEPGDAACDVEQEEATSGDVVPESEGDE